MNFYVMISTLYIKGLLDKLVESMLDSVGVDKFLKKSFLYFITASEIASAISDDFEKDKKVLDVKKLKI